MKSKNSFFTPRLLIIAVQIVLGSAGYVSSVEAADENKDQDPSVQELIQPKSKLEIGVGSESERSSKANEYNGHRDNGAYGIANIDIRGGAAYDSDSALRWRITGKDLGLENRNLKIDGGEQGKYRLEFGYDEILRNRSDTYQTPYSGAENGNLTLPSNWVVPILPRVSSTAVNARGLSSDVSNSQAIVSNALTSPTTPQRNTSSALQAADLPAFHNINLSTKREKYNAGITLDLDDGWEFKASTIHEDKNGYKPMGTVTRATGGDISTIIPDKIDQTTNQFNVALGYTNDKGFLNAGYYGSFFDNHVKNISWQNWADPTKGATISSAPSNEFNQFSLTGGYNFTSSTKLVLNGSYARSTQNQAFFTDASTPVISRSSLDGLVVTKAFNMKLTAKPLQGFNVSGAYKFEDRDNQTPVSIFGYYDANEPSAAIADGTKTLNANFKTALATLTGLNLNSTTLGSNLNINASRPYSKKSQQVNLYGDYMVKQGQWVGAGYDWQGIDRKCDGSWISCVDSDSSNEHTLKFDWRTSTLENFTTKLDYAYSKRSVDYNENAFLALVPMANVVPTATVTGTAYATAGTVTSSAYAMMQALGFSGYGPALGLPGSALSTNQAYFYPLNNALANSSYQNQNRISELIGMRRYNMADRDRNKLRGSANWQATDRISFQSGFSWKYDDYANSVYGLKSSRDWSLNLDGSFAVNEDLTLTAFYNHEDQQNNTAGNTYTANSITTASSFANTVSGGCAASVTARNQSYKILSCMDWSTSMQDKVDTLGLSFKRDKAFVHNLDLAGSLSYSWATTDVGVSGGSYATSLYTPSSSIPGAFYIPATALPTVTTKTLDLQLSGKYTINKASSIWAGYNFMHMTSSDYAYQGMQIGGLAGVLPTSEKAPSYNVHLIGASYIYSF